MSKEQKKLNMQLIATKISIVLVGSRENYEKITYSYNSKRGIDDAIYELLTTTDLAEKSQLFNETVVKKISLGREENADMSLDF